MSDEKEKPGFDEQTLARLLEAAYVLQESLAARPRRSEGQGAPPERTLAEAATTTIATAAPEAPQSVINEAVSLPLAQIVEIQHRIQAHELPLENALSLIVDRLLEIGRAAGAAVGIVEGKNVRYKAAAGQKAPDAGSEVPLDKALCIPCIRTGEVFRCPDVTPKIHLDVAECRRRGIQSLIAVPVFQDSEIAGGLELYYSDPRAFTEQEVQTCQLMAGLITEALTREAQTSSSKILATERSRMLDALEKLKPNLSAIVDKPAVIDGSVAAAYSCGKCGHPMVAAELFCGQCGTPQISKNQSSPEQAQGNTSEPAPGAAPDLAFQATKKLTIGEDEDTEHILSGTSLEELAKSFESEMHEHSAAPEVQTAGFPESAESAVELLGAENLEAGMSQEPASETQAESKEEDEPVESVALTKPAAVNWSSAHSAREFLEQLAGASRGRSLAQFWSERRGDIYLAIAVVLVLCVIRWGIWSSPSVNAKAAPANATAAHHKSSSPDADLSLFDRMLISLGLADAPEAAEDKGNPATQVWVDLHTALYYCPGADLYGKTATGKYTSQREAQLDQFEPAYREACK